MARANVLTVARELDRRPGFLAIKYSDQEPDRTDDDVFALFLARTDAQLPS